MANIFLFVDWTRKGYGPLVEMVAAAQPRLAVPQGGASDAGKADRWHNPIGGTTLRVGRARRAVPLLKRGRLVVVSLDDELV